MSQELVNNLRRHIIRFNKDMAKMDGKMTGKSTGRENKFMVRETKETIKSIKESIE